MDAEKSGAFHVRPMAREELDVALSWAKREGWNPGLHDAGSFYAADPKGFFAGEFQEQVAATISAVAYGEDFGFLGFYIVKPELRGRGFGLAVWKAAMARLGQRNIGLDGVLAQEKNYEKSGFKTAYHNIRFQCMGGGFPPQGATPLGRFSLDDIVEYDSRFFPVRRRAFLEGWLAMPNGFSYAVERSGRLAGYGVIRTCVSGFKIGPLFADDPEAAETLFRALRAHASNGPLFLDVPGANKQGLDLARKFNMKKSFETLRMYTGPAPGIDLDGVFGVTSFELG